MTYYERKIKKNYPKNLRKIIIKNRREESKSQGILSEK
jgi:hypothetical protein